MDVLIVIGKGFLTQGGIFIASILFGAGTTLGIFTTLKFLRVDIVHKVVVGKDDDTKGV